MTNDVLAEWTIAGNVLLPCALETDEVWFAGSYAIAANGSVSSQLIEGTLAEPQLVVNARCSAANGAVSVSEVSETGRFSVSLCPSSKIPLGRFRYPVVVTVATRDAQPLYQTTVFVNGDIISPIHFSPSELLLGCQRIGVPVSRDIALHLDIGDDVLLSTSHSTVQAEAVSDPSNGLQVVRLTLTPDSLGFFTGTVTAQVVIDNDGHSIEAELPVSVYCVK